ncbi:MAG: DUF1178 family protein [Alphaproteobacteria bacterium]|nr:DUF1178 family protein [Alphaproteobacteria bacterium]
MIVYDLHCAQGHRFEGWFGSSGDFAEQQDRGLVECPECGSQEVGKAPMAPAVPAKGNQRENVVAGKDGKPVTNRAIPPEVHQAMRALAEAQAKALRKSTYVGDGFAEESRAMHYGEKDVEAIHGKATVREAKELIEEGIAVAPLPFPIAEPDKLN